MAEEPPLHSDRLGIHQCPGCLTTTFCSPRVVTGSSHSHGFLSEDVEDELIREEVILSPVPSMLKLQIVSKPMDLSVAKVGVNLKV